MLLGIVSTIAVACVQKNLLSCRIVFRFILVFTQAVWTICELSIVLLILIRCTSCLISILLVVVLVPMLLLHELLLSLLLLEVLSKTISLTLAYILRKATLSNSRGGFRCHWRNEIYSFRHAKRIVTRANRFTFNLKFLCLVIKMSAIVL